MKYTLALLVLLTSVFLNAYRVCAQVLMPERTATGKFHLLNGNWKFKYYAGTDCGRDSAFYNLGYDVSSWRAIATPGNWELQGIVTPEYGDRLQEGTGLYVHAFTVPAGWSGQQVHLAFDGVAFGYTVWVNGLLAGTFASAYNRKTFDVSSLVKRNATNTLAVKVITKPMGWDFDCNDDWALSGIIRDVTLFAQPKTHLRNLGVVTTLEQAQARVQVQVAVGGKPEADLHINGQLLNAAGRLVKEFAFAGTTAAGAGAVTHSFLVSNPRLWTAESPSLYVLRLFLTSKGKVIHRYQQRIGLRQVTWANGVFSINGRPVKLKGVDHHDLSPVNGRAITEAEMKEDLVLMRKANINFVRTSHYPPHPRFTELCDSMGIYVMEEVPFGHGDKNLNDSAYLPLLLNRAEATVARDKNRPCVIAWSLGNENPVTRLTIRTAGYVKQLDPTRPVCFPQRRSELEHLMKAFPDSMDVYAPHYPNVSRLYEYASRFDRPVVLTEYAHALGLDADLLDSLYNIIVKYPRLAGGAIWMFQDQGLLRRATEQVNKHDYTQYTWKDSLHLYDTHGEDGTDGIVYANRVPQVDYWQVRKVYTPVIALDDTLPFIKGKQELVFTLVNRYDFTPLSAVTCNWELYGDTAKLGAGTVAVKGKPHDTAMVRIAAAIPAASNARYYYLKVMLKNKERYQFYEKTYTFKKEVTPLLFQKTVNDYAFAFDSSAGIFTLKNKKGQLLVAGGPYVRVGRKPTMAMKYFTAQEKHRNQLWPAHLLTQHVTHVQYADAKNIKVDFIHATDSALGAVTGYVHLHASDSGFVQVDYTLSISGKVKLPEAGLSFLLPAGLTEFRWAGKGPYEAYPGKDRLSGFGLYHLNNKDIAFQGNRQQVDIAMFTDGAGNGLALIADKADIAVEHTEAGLVVSHNALVSGRFNKFGWPDLLYSADEKKQITGSFRLLPLAGSWPPVIQQLFGTRDSKAIPFRPFYHSYDQ